MDIYTDYIRVPYTKKYINPSTREIFQKDKLKRIFDIHEFNECKGYSNYLINFDKGKVIHKDNKLPLGYKNHTGYESITIKNDENKINTMQLHRFIWEQKHGKIPDKYEIDHINSNRTDNRISNLRCVSRQQNRKFAVQKRIRPIFMTTLSTSFGLLPLAIIPGAGAELYRGLAVIILSGLLISTIFTLFLTPMAIITVNRFFKIK